MQNSNLSEERISFGDLLPEHTFYIIRRMPLGAGLFSNFLYVYGHLLYALEKGYIPVIDMQNYKTYFNETELINDTNNAWEYYFCQPLHYTLQDIQYAKNVILSSSFYLFDKVPEFLHKTSDINNYHSVITKYLQFNDITKQYIREQQQKLFNNKSKILGVKYRGTDYKSESTAGGHFVPASLSDCVAKTKDLLKEWGMEWIYLSTEESAAVECFRQTFGDILIVTDSYRIEHYDAAMGGSVSVEFNRQHDNYLKGLEYIADTVLLSECDALIASKNNGSYAAIGLNNNRYKNKFIFDLGRHL
ncbi:hypothetical protein FACS189487_00860 [Campylobacterota bacterium]|nr:hypothetical protein FACS189487_00860 [Campylobacterota bacterium]